MRLGLSRALVITIGVTASAISLWKASATAARADAPLRTYHADSPVKLFRPKAVLMLGGKSRERRVRVNILLRPHAAPRVRLLRGAGTMLDKRRGPTHTHRDHLPARAYFRHLAAAMVNDRPHLWDWIRR